MKYLAAMMIVLLAGIGVYAERPHDDMTVSPPFLLAAKKTSGAKHSDGPLIKCRRTGMVLCDKCCEKYRPELKGDGECPRHGTFSFSMDRLAVPCARCAREKGICQMCGKPLGGK